MKNTFDAIIAAPFGSVAIQAQDDFLTALELYPHAQNLYFSSNPFVLDVIKQIEAYFKQAEFRFDIPYAVKGTPFQKRVWQAMQNTAAGETLTYGDLAAQVSSGPRAVANACGANQIPIVIPCHRIVAKNGLGGYMQGVAGGLEIKRWLLAHESNQY